VNLLFFVNCCLVVRMVLLRMQTITLFKASLRANPNPILTLKQLKALILHPKDGRD
jgi:hypothetical protein